VWGGLLPMLKINLSNICQFKVNKLLHFITFVMFIMSCFVITGCITYLIFNYPDRNHFSLLCHQIPERCFIISDKIFPICARCTGIYIGVISILILKRINIFSWTILGILFIIEIAIKYSDYPTTNLLRFISGYCMAIFFVALCGIYDLLIIKLESHQLKCINNKQMRTRSF
jgi:uncharacterized membrane protein